MRPTPARLPDELLMRAAPQLVDGDPDAAIANPAQRAAVQAAVRAQLHPSPRTRRASQPRRQFGTQPSLGFDDQCVDIKRRAANDIDED
ncbi:hypothetical protein BX589_101259 [Paraburkholderia fungorum]|uniref:hypothetical protein n=1 Tax=Paraburkholderia fungorum TaxID=134537 RepID=UPI000D41658F|nr:hypothetical protein [Paraburkholderia fungorum]PRZ56609.1 hypothetical protein BX589_101259 [Paraburkholderia fungorum]